ncbi:MAG TPA: hypothetical protein VIT20_08505, partial [Propionibacteriaceae bacterium]
SVVFVAADGSAVPGVDLTQLLQAAGAHGWRVEQRPDGSVRAEVVRGDAARVDVALTALFGQPIEVVALARLADLGEGKPRRYEVARREPSRDRAF